MNENLSFNTAVVKKNDAVESAPGIVNLNIESIMNLSPAKDLSNENTSDVNDCSTKNMARNTAIVCVKTNGFDDATSTIDVKIDSEMRNLDAVDEKGLHIDVNEETSCEEIITGNDYIRGASLNTTETTSVARVSERTTT